MNFGERMNAVLTQRCQHKPDNSPVSLVSMALNEPEGLDPAHQLHHAVLSHQQILRNLADRRAAGIAMTFHRQQQLVLYVREPNSAGSLLAPPVEPSQRGAEPQQRGEVRLARSPRPRLRHGQSVVGHRATAMSEPRN